MVRIMALSDTHGILPELNLDGIDLVLFAGDFSARHRDDFYSQIDDYVNNFCPWAREIAKQSLFYWIAGNHEVFLEAMPNYTNDVIEKYCLNNRSVSVSNLDILIHGIPQTNRFCNWGFNVEDTPEGIGQYCKNIPRNTTIILSHGPVYGINDKVYKGRFYTHEGSKILYEKIIEIRPKVFISGHLHHDDNYGVVNHEGIVFAGVSQMNEEYENVRDPVILEL